ncbi:MAG: hypothetical protein ACRDH5_17300 [bacterium]
MAALVVVMWWLRVGWRLVRRSGRRGLGVLHPLAQTPRRMLLEPLVNGGIGGGGRKAD